MEQFLNELTPWLGLLLAMGVAVGVPAGILRAIEKRQEKQKQASREALSHNVIPLHHPLDRQFLNRCANHEHMNRPAEKVRN